MMDLDTHETLVSLAQFRLTRATAKLANAEAEMVAAGAALKGALAARDHCIANTPTDEPLML